MKNTFGSSVTVTLFGESHGTAIGAVLDGLAPGIPVDEAFIARQLALRAPEAGIGTARHEEDLAELVSGVFEGKTTGTPLCVLIRNTDARSADYGGSSVPARPGHADYTAHEKYHGFEDYRGGGHFSGRLTAPLVAVGSIALTALRGKGIRIGTHITRCGGEFDRGFDDLSADIAVLSDRHFAVLDEARGEAMRAAILSAAAEGDSVGGVLETAVTGLSAAPKQIVGMGAYLVIFPDKVYFNTADQSDWGSLEAHFAPQSASYELCRFDGTALRAANDGPLRGNDLRRRAAQ